jgi:hypothetical protein
MLTNFSNRITGIPLFSKRGCAKPHFHMGIPVWKWGLIFFNPHMETGIPHFYMGMCQSPFPYLDPPMETFLAAKFFGNAMAPGA